MNRPRWRQLIVWHLRAVLEPYYPERPLQIACCTTAHANAVEWRLKCKSGHIILWVHSIQKKLKKVASLLERRHNVKCMHRWTTMTTSTKFAKLIITGLNLGGMSSQLKCSYNKFNKNPVWRSRTKSCGHKFTKSMTWNQHLQYELGTEDLLQDYRVII